MAATTIQSPSPVSESIFELIVALIQERELQVGDQLPSIRELAKLFGYKATAVRDSLVQAQALGLVKILPRAGAFVQQRSLPQRTMSLATLPTELGSLLERDDHNMFHLLDARRVIELELGSRAIARRQMEDLLPLRQTLEAMTNIPVSQRGANYVDLDMQLHMQLARLGGNEVLAIVLETILHRLRPYLECLPWDEERRRRTDQLHTELYRSLVDGDLEAFRAGIGKHQASAYGCLLSQVQTPPVSSDVEPLPVPTTQKANV